MEPDLQEGQLKGPLAMGAGLASATRQQARGTAKSDAQWRPWGGVGRIIVGGHEGVREKGPAGKVLEMHTGNLVSLGLSIQLYLCC